MKIFKIFRATECGHLTRTKGHKFCPKCFKKKVILCFHCRNHVFPGHFVILHTPSKTYEIPPHAHMHDGKIVACTGCSKHEAHGIWTGKEIKRIK
ncbi:MAG: hypothetical protein WCG91_01705 [Candidatus Shapirobacteria bacterium]